MTEKNEKQFVTVTIPISIYEKIEGRITGSGFASISDYITFVMKEVLSDNEGETVEKVLFTKEDEENVKERLRALGYID